jgi:outer membrane biosynthesis protein TonB
MSKRDGRDRDGRDRDRRDYDRRDYQPDDDQQRRSGDGDLQEGDSLTALKAILSKVAAQLRPLNLTAEESIRLVEQLYGSVLDMDVALAGEADDTRKSSTLAYLQNTTIRREGDRLVVEYPTADALRAADAPAADAAADMHTEGPADRAAPQTAAREPAPARPPRGGPPRQAPPREDSATQTPKPEPVEPQPVEHPEPGGPEA